MTDLVWTVRRIAHMMRFSKHLTMIYIDHDVNATIADQITLSTTNIDKLNMKLIRASIYLSQFRLEIRHRSEKSNIVSDALSRLTTRKHSMIDNLNLKQDSVSCNFVESEILTIVFDDFKQKLIIEYKMNSWANITRSLQKLEARLKKKNVFKIKSSHSDSDFSIRDDFIYLMKDSKSRLCISENCEKKIFKAAHDQNFHVEHHRVYERLMKSVFISRMSRKLHFYIKHCSSCQLNQIKRHLSYEKLISIFSLALSFRKLIMNFIVTLSEVTNFVLTITCKTSKRLTIIFELIIWFVIQWADALMNRLLISDWEISKEIISDRDLKFLSEFWIAIFKRLDIIMLLFTAYHSQTNELSERSNQTVKIALRFFIIENLETNWVTILSLMQIDFNNSSNAFTGLSSNEIIYDFKIRDVFTTLAKNTHASTTVVSDINTLNETRLRFRQKATDVVSFVNIKAKIYFDKRHLFLLMKSEDKTFLRLHKDYTLSSKHNAKLSNQRCDSFVIKRRIERLAYELELSSKWKIHSMISIAQLKSVIQNVDSYNRYRSHHFESIEIASDIEIEKSYEVEKIVTKRIKRYDKIMITQYLIRWLEYDSEYDEWRGMSDLTECLDLIEKFEKEQHSSIKIISAKSSRKTTKLLINWEFQVRKYHHESFTKQRIH